MSSVDPDLLEMAAIYRFSLWIKIRDIYLMSIAAPLASGVAIVVGNGVRVVILSEVLGANEGIGYVLSSARTNLDIPDLYALVLLSLLIVGITDFFLLKPAQRRLMRWRVRSDD
jgi:NitT/TauT family transport system permease protein